jgi:acylphosphatase
MAVLNPAERLRHITHHGDGPEPPSWGVEPGRECDRAAESRIGAVSNVRVRVVVEGRVQGVFFRDSCRAQASRLGVAGWVRNRADGSVEAAFEGDAAAVASMVAWCRSGPPRADVVGVRTFDEPPEGDRSFRVVN